MDLTKNPWSDLWRSSPGQRFQTKYELTRATAAPSHPLAHLARMAGGGLIAFVGVILLLTPGPGLVFLVVGGSMLASESLAVAQRLDGWELAMRACLKRWRRGCRVG